MIKRLAAATLLLIPVAISTLPFSASSAQGSVNPNHQGQDLIIARARRRVPVRTCTLRHHHRICTVHYRYE
jgi:hypothetical protein